MYPLLSNNQSRKCLTRLHGFGVLWVGLWLMPAQGAELPGGLQIHGFASQAFILTSDNDFFGDSDNGGSFDFRELGLNASLRPLPRLQLSAQILSRRAGESDNGGINLDFAFADYSFISNPSNLVGLRAGRIKNSLGLYNDTRDVAFTRPSILLPQSIYFDRTRDFALSADSAELYGEHRTAAGTINLQLSAGRPRVSDDETELAFLGDRPGELDGDVSFIGRVIYEHAGGRLRFALSAAQVNIDYDPLVGAPDDLTAGSIRFQPWILSAQYNAERWSVTSEYAQRRSRFESLGAIPDATFTGESYYLQGTYRFTPSWEALLRYDVLFTNKDDRDGEDFARLSGRPAHNGFAKDLTVGLGWNITPSLLLRVEYHNIDGTGWLPIPDNPDLAATEEHWDMYLLQGSYRF